MDTIEMTRELGKLLQQEDSYKNMRAAESKADADTELQGLIKDFNIKRLSVNVETQKTEKNGEKIAQLNKEMQKVYADIMANENMKAYNEAKQEFDKISGRVMTILQNCIAGEDPETTDFDASCTGSCSTCGGCG